MSDRADLAVDSLLPRLRAGDDAAFAAIVDHLNGRLLALARTFTSSPALAEDIVQETWLGVIRGLRGFESRSTLRTWIFSILVRRARTMAAHDARQSFATAATDGAAGSAEWTPGSGKIGLWTEPPVPWGLVDPASVFQSLEALEIVRHAVDQLPERQRQVLVLRDVEDVPAKDICNILELSETNLRVLLHRGRARVREALDRYMRGAPRGQALANGRSTARSSRPTYANGDHR